MSLKDLSTQTMVELSRRWLETHRTTLQNIPQVSGMVPNLEKAHNGVFTLTRPTPAVSPEVTLIIVEQRGLDTRHDALIDAGLSLIAACRALYPEEAVLLDDLRDHVYSIGASGKILSYAEESGAATLLERRLTDKDKERLKNIALTKDGVTSSLLDLLNEQIEKAKKLGVLDEQKGALLRSEGDPSIASRADALAARNAWIRTVHALQSNLALAVDSGDLSSEAMDDLLADLLLSVKKAERAPAKPQAEADPNAPLVTG